MLISGDFFELIGAIKELGYAEIEKIYYKDPTTGMNLLYDDRGALEIADLYRVHLSVEVCIQHTLSQPDFVDENEVVLDEITLNVIVDEIEEMLKETEAVVDDVRMNDVSVDDDRVNDVTDDENVNDVRADDNVNDVRADDNVNDVRADGNVNDVRANDDDIGQRASEVDDDVRLSGSNDSYEDSSFNYDSAMGVV